MADRVECFGKCCRQRRKPRPGLWRYWKRMSTRIRRRDDKTIIRQHMAQEKHPGC